jgi:hypothetical protein
VLPAVAVFTREAERLLRAPGHFNWSTITLLALVVYVYAAEVERSNWSAILAGVAFWLMDWFNEIVNALVLHFNGHAALWTVTGSSSYLILIGLPIEVSLFFAINGVIFVKLLPADRDVRILGLPNRWAIALALSLISVGVELLLHALGVFHWYYWWWNVASFPVIATARNRGFSRHTRPDSGTYLWTAAQLDITHRRAGVPTCTDGVTSSIPVGCAQLTPKVVLRCRRCGTPREVPPRTSEVSANRPAHHLSSGDSGTSW